jgi:hypothetical protein
MPLGSSRKIGWETHQLLVYADNVNLLGDNIDSIKKNTETLTDASKEIDLEINVEKTEYSIYILLSCHQNVGQNRNIKTGNRSFENVSQFCLLVCCRKVRIRIHRTIILPLVLCVCVCVCVCET